MSGVNDYGEPKTAQHHRGTQAVLNESRPLSDTAGGHARGIEDQPSPIDVKVRIEWAASPSPRSNPRQRRSPAHATAPRTRGTSTSSSSASTGRGSGRRTAVGFDNREVVGPSQAGYVKDVANWVHLFRTAGASGAGSAGCDNLSGRLFAVCTRSPTHLPPTRQEPAMTETPESPNPGTPNEPDDDTPAEPQPEPRNEPAAEPDDGNRLEPGLND